MAGQYIVSDYKRAGARTPRISYRTPHLTEAEAWFTRSAHRRVQSVVLYNTHNDRVLKIAIEGEPIYLVEVIEKARVEFSPEARVTAAAKIAAIEAAGIAIGQMVQALTGVTVSGLGNIVVALFMVPYYISKGDVAAATGSTVGLFAGLAGAEITERVAGPKWRWLGGLACGIAAGAGASAAVNSLTRKCRACEGAGLVLDFRRCRRCNGKGYRELNV